MQQDKNTSSERLDSDTQPIFSNREPNIHEKLLMQQKLISGIERAENVLISGSHYYKTIGDALGILGETAEVDRVYIFENHIETESGEQVVSQRFEWSKDIYETQIDNPILQQASYKALGMERWYDLLSRNQSINGPISEFPESERIFLMQQDIVSLIVVPVIIKNRLWGFIGFDDCKNVRRWEKYEETVLRIIAASFARSMETHRQALALNRQSQVIGTILQNTADGVIIANDDGRITQINSKAVEMTGYQTGEAIGEATNDIFRLIDTRKQQPQVVPILEIIRKYRTPRTSSVMSLQPKTGDPFPIDYTISLLHSAEGIADGALITFRHSAVQARST
ncbi:MAG: PAS domain-containing protein [Deferribacteres bacterium]|nr:PAS domain-containing protein [candidate division KSB1 bacterium]MCB9509756.1 PAS domain-containing protein [Deferribacteres bacterium]